MNLAAFSKFSQLTHILKTFLNLPKNIRKFLNLCCLFSFVNCNALYFVRLQR